MTFTTNTVCYFGDASLRLLDFFEETILLLHLHFLVSVFQALVTQPFVSRRWNPYVASSMINFRP